MRVCGHRGGGGALGTGKEEGERDGEGQGKAMGKEGGADGLYPPFFGLR